MRSNGMVNLDRTWYLLVLVLFSYASTPAKGSDGYAIAGRVKIDGLGIKGFGLPGKLANAKIFLNGGQSVTFLRPDVRVDVSARYHGKVQAALTENRRILTELVLEPLREEQYYEVREAFSIWSLLKSPMGLMVGFMVIVVFLMPKLMESMDPEEMRQAQEQMRGQGIPSISSLLPGNSR